MTQGRPSGEVERLRAIIGKAWRQLDRGDACGKDATEVMLMLQAAEKETPPGIVYDHFFEPWLVGSSLPTCLICGRIGGEHANVR
jgi:hypothetical protein